MTEAKVEAKDGDSDSEQQNRGSDAVPAVASQPQRVALFPGMDPSALKVNYSANMQTVTTYSRLFLKF